MTRLIAYFDDMHLRYGALVSPEKVMSLGDRAGRPEESNGHYDDQAMADAHGINLRSAQAQMRWPLLRASFYAATIG